jgi:hypothetical protein
MEICRLCNIRRAGYSGLAAKEYVNDPLQALLALMKGKLWEGTNSVLTLPRILPDRFIHFDFQLGLFRL